MVPGASQDITTLAIRNSAIEFCEETGVTDFVDTPKTLVAGQATYAIGDTGIAYSVARIKEAVLDNDPLEATSVDELSNRYIDWAKQTATPKKYVQLDPTQIRLFPIPDKSVGTLYLTYTTKPTRTSTGIDDFIFDRYVEAIADGAIARLASMPNKPWSSPSVAATANVDFCNKKRDAKIEVNKSFTRAKLKVKLKRIV